MPTATKTKKSEPTETPEPDLTLGFTAKAEDLKAAIAIAERFASPKSTLPVLSCFAIGANDSLSIELAASNLDAFAIVQVPAALICTGATVCVDARTFTDWIKLQDDEASVSFTLLRRNKTAGYKLFGSCGKQTYEFSTIPGEDFPPLPTITNGKQVSFPTDELKEAISQVAYAAAPDETRPVLSGVMFDLKGGEVTAVAADGFRLAARTWKTEAVLEQDTRLIVPSKFVDFVARAISATDEPGVRLAWTTNQLAVAFNTFTLGSRLIEGQFPDYERIIPSEKDVKVDFQVARKAMLKAVRAAMVAAKSASSIVKLEKTINFVGANDTPEAWSLKVWSTSAEGDTETDELMVDWNIHPLAFDFTIAFNGRYLLDMLTALPSDYARFQLSSNTSPGITRPVGSAADLIDVMMPMHTVGNNR